MADETTQLAINDTELNALGIRLYTMFTRYERDRYPMEQQAMRSLRQYRGIYDPETRIRPYGSTAYPKFTKKWVKGTVSRLMQLSFPEAEHNWDAEPTPIPELSTQDLQALLNEMQDAADQAQQPLTDEQIEAQIKIVAQAKCERMKTTMQDQLDEMDYVSLAKKVVKSGVLYGEGLLSGPLHEKETHRSWRKDMTTGRYIAQEAMRLTPKFEFETIWDWYPDLSAKTSAGQDGYFFRRVMSREQVRKLSERPDFMESRIKEWLQKNSSGNYRERYWELEIRVDGDRKYTSELNKRKYEAMEWWGFVSGHELKAAGIEISDDKLGEQYESNVWTIGNVVIKAILNPMERKRRPLHEFVFEEDDISMTGVGLPSEVRDSQLAIAESTRMLLDNSSVCSTPSKLIKYRLLMPGHNYDSTPYKDWYQGNDDFTEDTADAVKNLEFKSYIAELIEVITLFKGIGEEESSMSPISQGNVSAGGSEGVRTQGNMSMAMGAASLPIRDVVRNFDLFTESVMTGLYDWNMEFNEDQKIKGDFNIVAKGSTSLMAKEVRAQHLNNFAPTIQPEEREHINWREMLSERTRAMDVPGRILLDETIVEQNRQTKQKEMEEMKRQQQELMAAEIRSVISDAIKNTALAQKASAGADAKTYETLMAGLKQLAEQDNSVLDKITQHIQDLREHGHKTRELDIRQQEADAIAAAAAQPATENQ